MLELGPRGRALHRGLLAPVDVDAIDLVFCCGPLMRARCGALPASRRGGYAKDSAALEPQVLSAVGAGDVVMVKGSLARAWRPSSRRCRSCPSGVTCWKPRPHKVEAMFYLLVELSDKLSILNVFRYITFRTGGAVITGLIFVFPLRADHNSPPAPAAGEGPADPRRRAEVARHRQGR